MNNKFLSYAAFPKAAITDLFSTEKLEKSIQKKMCELGSIHYENVGNGNLKKKSLPTIAQKSTIHDIAVEDFDNDGFKDLSVVGSTHKISVHIDRMDAPDSIILLSDKEVDSKG